LTTFSLRARWLGRQHLHAPRVVNYPLRMYLLEIIVHGERALAAEERQLPYHKARFALIVTLHDQAGEVQRTLQIAVLSLAIDSCRRRGERIGPLALSAGGPVTEFRRKYSVIPLG